MIVNLFLCAILQSLNFIFNLISETLFYWMLNMKSWKNASESDRKTYESISQVFFSYPYLLNNFFDKDKPKIRLQSEKMLEQASGLSSGEFVLIKVALDIWSGSGNAYVWELVETLDKQNFYSVLTALALIRKDRL